MFPGPEGRRKKGNSTDNTNPVNDFNAICQLSFTNNFSICIAFFQYTTNNV